LFYLTFHTTALPCGISVDQETLINWKHWINVSYVLFLGIRTWTNQQLLVKSGTFSSALYNKRIQNMLLICYKCLNFSDYPKYLKELFTRRSVIYYLRGTNILSLPKPVSTTYGLHSFRYLAAKTWNLLPDTIRKHHRNILRIQECHYKNKKIGL
jgi:hypothetical protein